MTLRARKASHGRTIAGKRWQGSVDVTRGKYLGERAGENVPYRHTGL